MNATIIKKLLVVFSLLLLALTVVFGATTNPSAPSGIGIISNTTTDYATNGLIQNSATRGYIYTMNINESQPSNKWVGYVGNITGNFALEDSSARALYNWSIAVTKGEIYAQIESAAPTWSVMRCAKTAELYVEETYYSHTTADEDSYSNTFRNNSVSGYSNPQIYVGDRQVASANASCHGLRLNNNTGSPGLDWDEVVLTDGGNDGTNYELTYAALIENSAIGFDGKQYDFQIMLPQNATAGDVAVIPYYFYIELV